ncbi:MAG: DUF2141 domain-containing protein [Elusimicrobiota bacterium]
MKYLIAAVVMLGMSAAAGAADISALQRVRASQVAGIDAAVPVHVSGPVRVSEFAGKKATELKNTGDVVITVDRFAAPSDAPVIFAVCGSEKCHDLQDKGYKTIGAELIATSAAVRKYKISGLKPGEYSLSGYNDLNKNGVMDRGMFGIPQEPAGFSKLDTDKLSSNPSWNSVKFTVGAAPVEVTFHLIHKFGL